MARSGKARLQVCKPDRKVRQKMGMVADELDHLLMAHKALLSADVPVTVSGTGLMCPSGPVSGIAFVQADSIDHKMDVIAKALQNVSTAIRKLEDRLKKLEDQPAVRPLPNIPQGFRR